MIDIKTTQDGFGIHTFMITSQLDYKKYRELKLILQKNIWEKQEFDNHSYIKSKFFMEQGYFGISSKLYLQNGFARLEIIVNPIDLLEERYTHTRIFSKRFECKNVVKKLNEALSLINMDISQFILSRVDLCVNFTMPSEMVKTYLKLARKSYIRKNMQLKTFSDNESNNHSLTIACPSFEIEIYDKEYAVHKYDDSYQRFGCSYKRTQKKRTRRV